MNRISLLAIVCAAAAATVSGEVTLYVSGSGNDSNQCSLNSPCRTFAGALAVDNSSHSDGSIVALDSSDFGNGATLNINSSVTLDGGAHGAFLSGPPNAQAVALALSNQATVTIRNLTIVAGRGLADAAISGTLASSVLNLENLSAITVFSNAGNGILLQMDSTSQVNLTDVTVTEGATCLMFSSASATTRGVPAPFSVSLERVIADGCTNAGLLVLGGSATVRDSTFRGSNIGVQFASPSAASNSLIEHSQFYNNTTGVSADAPYTVRLSNSVLSSNVLGLNGAGTFISFRNNVFAGNGTDGNISLSTSLK